jgi:hypothetical protein
MEPDRMNLARQARDKLVSLLLDDPNVSLIDIGLDPEPAGGGQVVLRVHLRRLSDRPATSIPADVDGIPVIVLGGDYQIEDLSDE